MKKLLLLTLPFLILALLMLLTSCGNTVSIEQYDEVVAAKIKAEAELADQMDLNNELNSELADKEAWISEMEVNTANLQAEIDVLEAKYPPRLFEDADELEAWLIAQPNALISTDAVLWLSHARQIQQKAIEDGYIINIECTTEDGYTYIVNCTAILDDDSYYFWDPEKDEIYYWLDVRHF